MDIVTGFNTDLDGIGSTEMSSNLEYIYAGVSNFLTVDEKICTLGKLVKDRNVRDTAMMFITQIDVDIDDIFEHHYMILDDVEACNFYTKVFSYIGSYINSRVGKTNLLDSITKILDKLHVDYVFSVNALNSRVSRTDLRSAIVGGYLKDLIQTVFVRDLIVHAGVVGHLAERNLVNFIVNSLLCRPSNFPTQSLYNIISTKKITGVILILEDLIATFSIDVQSALYIMSNRSDDLSMNQIKELLDTLVNSDDNILRILRILTSRYEVVPIRNTGNYTVRYIKNNSTSFNANTRDKKFNDVLRGFITERIVGDAEREIRDLAEIAEVTYYEGGVRSIIYLDIWRKINEFLNSDDRRFTMVKNMNQRGEEESSDLFDIDTLYDFLFDSYHIHYISEIGEYTEYNSFIRLFNINRFGFLSMDRTSGIIRDGIKNQIVGNSNDYIVMAIDLKVYNIIFNYM